MRFMTRVPGDAAVWRPELLDTTLSLFLSHICLVLMNSGAEAKKNTD